MSQVQNCPWCGYGTWNGKVCLTCGAKERVVSSFLAKKLDRAGACEGGEPTP